MTDTRAGERFRVCGICGSLRKASFNAGLLRAAQELGREHGLDVEIYAGLGDVPPYNQDLDVDGQRPEPVEQLKRAIAGADALLIATPEYNYNVPGLLKNAIDWASRPPRQGPIYRRPTAIMGASTGMSGTIRAQLALRQSLLFNDMPTLQQPEVLIPKCADRFDAEGNLTDQSTRELVGKQMAAFAALIRMVNASGIASTG